MLAQSGTAPSPYLAHSPRAPAQTPTVAERCRPAECRHNRRRRLSAQAHTRQVRSQAGQAEIPHLRAPSLEMSGPEFVVT
jgi:hypothetical protein